MTGTVVFVIAGAAATGVLTGAAVGFFTTTALIEAYVRHSRWKDYSLPYLPWVRGPNAM